MARGRYLLTDAKVQALLKRGIKQRVRDGDGLWLNISGPQKGSWVSRYTVKSGDQNAPRESGIGTFPLISLSEARAIHRGYKSKAAKGINPTEEPAHEDNSFEKVFCEYFQKKRRALNNEKNIKQWESTMRDYVFPVIGSSDISVITHHEIVRILEPIWLSIPDTASKVLQRVSNVFDYAIAHDYRSLDNPADAKRLQHILPSKPLTARRQSHPFIPPDRFPNFFKFIFDQWNANSQVKDPTLGALIFKCLTTARSQTVRYARMQDIDFERGFWIPPPDTMKFGQDFRYPLSNQALQFLKLFPENSGLIFPSINSNRPLSDHALSGYMRNTAPEKLVLSDLYDKEGNRRKAVPHGIRSTFSTWANENDFDDVIIEMCLAHADKNRVRAAYQRSDLSERRREVFERWAEFLTQEVF